MQLMRSNLICRRDLMAFPVSLPDDGLIDISVQELVRVYSQ
jgi:hypothetical protein